MKYIIVRASSYGIKKLPYEDIKKLIPKYKIENIKSSEYLEFTVVTINNIESLMNLIKLFNYGIVIESTKNNYELKDNADYKLIIYDAYIK